MKRELSIDEMDFLETHLFDDELDTKFIVDKKAYLYLERAKKLPYEDILELGRFYLSNDEVIDGKEYLFSIAKKYNSNCMEVLQRMKEVSSIEKFKSNNLILAK